MHPIIQAYIDTNDRLSVILEKKHDNNQLLESVFLNLVNRINDEEIDPKLYQDVDQAILIGHSDPNVFLLFISYAISLNSRRDKLERANVLQSIGTSLPRENIHPVILSFFMIKMADIKFYEGKTVEYSQLLKEALSIVDRKWPKFSTILINIGSLISWEGRLKEFSKEDLALLENPVNETIAIASLQTRIANSIFTGNFKEGALLLQEHQSKPILGSRSFLKGCEDLVKIISGDFDERNYEEMFFKYYSKVCHLILNGKYEEARGFSETLQTKDWGKKFSQHFAKYTSLHIELCLQNIGKSRLLLKEIQQRDSVHYLDDFFLARIQLLEMNLKDANISFGRLIANINRYEAMPRLIFELQFAREMKPADILLLMNKINTGTDLKETSLEEKSSPQVAMAKGVKLLVGESDKLLQVKKLVKKFAKIKEPVLITGETGTGKELISRAIHDEGSNSNEPFLAINCGALTDSLLQSELFGYEAGAFTGAQKERKGIFEAAGKGTVFLDEFGDISQKLQASLLRVLESNEIRLIGGTKTRQISCKIVIATNIDLQQAVEEKKFREDLYFRLARFDIKLPPLRERPEDIPSLIHYFLGSNLNLNIEPKKISKKLLDALAKYRWPGNVRELKNEIERLKIMYPEKEILEIEDFDFSRLQGMPEPNFQVDNIATSISKEIEQTVKNDRVVNDRILKIVQKTSTVDQRQEFLKELFKQYKKLTRSQIMEIAEISPVTATKDLQKLCEMGFIERKTPTKSVKSHYFILAP